jgi:hypothetical protein
MATAMAAMVMTLGERRLQLVEESQCRLEAVRQSLALRMRQTLVIHTSNTVDHTYMTSLREKCRVVHEAPQSQETVDTSGICVVAKDASDAHHDATSTFTRSCFPGSYRRRAVEEASRIRSISGSRAVAHKANPYKPPNMSSPARNE